MQEIVYHSIQLKCDVKKAFDMFTQNEYLQSWLAEIADVEPKPGGKYELFWDPDDRENNSTIGCRITAIEEGKFVAFEWKGPKQFKHFMNNTVPLTHVVVFFLPCGRGGLSPCTEVHLVHTGWGEGGEWQEARSYFEKAWLIGLKNLEGKFGAVAQ
ncbi:MAG: SRPBCC domain-containing protein [candidate division WOR-3 bacterium]|nr:MAG: SRPBCC domain-containing protein [candidate division WOR-3 bacterium]